jgi:hypothetical protein
MGTDTLRDRPSSLKGRYAIADATHLRRALDPGASTAPKGRNQGQATACPHFRPSPINPKPASRPTKLPQPDRCNHRLTPPLATVEAGDQG